MDLDTKVKVPLFNVGQQVLVKHGKSWYPAKITRIEYVLCSSHHEMFQYLIRWDWPGWNDDFVFEDEIVHLAGGCGERKRTKTNFYHP